MHNKTHMFSAYSLGATLYMPVIHHSVMDILTGRAPALSSSVVLCLEDALHENDVDRGIAALIAGLEARQQVKPQGGPRIFVRPRSLDMAERLSSLKGIHTIEGFVAPKMRVENASEWLFLARQADLMLMPTLETPEFFDPGRMAAFRDVLNAEAVGRISAIRLGGNDLLGSLGLRRRAGVTSYEGPLGSILGTASSMLISSGYAVAAPVYDVIHDLDTLKREVAQDIEMGFISKTAIHPCQVGIIEDAMKADPADVEAAKAILDRDAKAVFQVGGVMCEPSTHHLWAKRILARNEIFGLAGMEADTFEPVVSHG
ncbi:MAG: HpcH/HpaI aldolase/citrate lyase family protein [Roseibium sp.]|uniref:HpcH/HpaI aldolase/citrate lyase family protein n=1 Tax=Roseibium sp. TaxID=1936156 RepID=UPI003296E250